ncbi:MAG TPA: branched-chain amino acid aminotransferase [Arachnia sp.]|nr:branched-chain amino acid aminotransferase [Arachnia sp.]HMT87214.1 branched-chain amino acid aminotransferase [Arachnia sp.]
MTLFDVRRTATPTSDADRLKALADPAFGKYYVDHMAVADYTDGVGWHDLRIEPMADFAMHPAAAVLHYGQEIFEGLKAYRREDGSVWLFRPEKNAARFVRSAERLGMAPLPEELFLSAVTQLVELEAAWVPSGEQEQSLYIRPFQIASEPYLGVREATDYRFAVIASPAGPYYSEAMKLWVTPNFTRSAPGGTGTAKCGGNYAASLIAAREAYEHGCGQVLWTDGAEHKWLEECGTMNVAMITSDGELLTPALGAILDGITRDSILALAPEHGLTPVERAISVDELLTGLASGYITEVFACGTAAVVTPIVGFKTPDRGEYVVADGQVGPLTREIRAHLVDIQFGRAEDTRGWTLRVA